MDTDPQPRRKVLKYLGTGAVVSIGAVVGVSQLSEPASASVALSFEDADVDVPEDREIEDLRLIGDISGDYTGAGTETGNVDFSANVEFGHFGSFNDNKEFDPTEASGTVDWNPSWSLVEETDFSGGTSDLYPDNHDATEVAYAATIEVTMEVYNDENYQVARDSKTKSATITFEHSNERDDDSDTPEDGDGSDDEKDGSASVEVTFSFEVDE